MFTTPTTIGKGENNGFCIGQRSQISLLALSVGQRLCIDFFVSRANFLNHFALTLGRYLFLLFFIQFIGSICRWRLCINFSISRVNFLTTLRSNLNVSCYSWSSLFNVDVNYSYIVS